MQSRDEMTKEYQHTFASKFSEGQGHENDGVGLRFRGDIGSQVNNGLLGEVTGDSSGQNIMYSQKFVDAITRRLESRIRDQEAKCEYLKREVLTKDLRVGSKSLDF